jgi:putative FmdB family regulatory protein
VPIYEYLCESCGRITEVIHKVSERGPSTCGECGSDRVARLVSRSAFQLKGGGWYADLYASRKKDGADGKPAAEKPAGEKTAPKQDAASGGASKPTGGGAETAKKA